MFCTIGSLKTCKSCWWACWTRLAIQSLLELQPPTQSASSTKSVTPQNQVIPVWPCGDHSNPALRRDYLENNNRGIILCFCAASSSITGLVHRWCDLTHWVHDTDESPGRRSVLKIGISVIFTTVQSWKCHQLIVTVIDRNWRHRTSQFWTALQLSVARYFTESVIPVFDQVCANEFVCMHTSLDKRNLSWSMANTNTRLTERRTPAQKWRPLTWLRLLSSRSTPQDWNLNSLGDRLRIIKNDSSDRALKYEIRHFCDYHRRDNRKKVLLETGTWSPSDVARMISTQMRVARK